MKQWTVSALLAVVGLLNVAPAIVFFAPQRSESLYGIGLSEPNLSIVMRHRAVLLGLLGVALMYAAFKREYVLPGIAAALIGKAAFLFLVYSSSGANAELGRIALFDIGAMTVLGAALGIHLSGSK